MSEQSQIVRYRVGAELAESGKRLAERLNIKSSELFRWALAVGIASIQDVIKRGEIGGDKPPEAQAPVESG